MVIIFCSFLKIDMMMVVMVVVELYVFLLRCELRDIATGLVNLHLTKFSLKLFTKRLLILPETGSAVNSSL